MPSAAATKTDFPPICLHPVADVQHAWAALLLETPVPLPASELTRLFGEFGLFEAMGSLPCIVRFDPLCDCDEIATLLPAERIILRLPVQDCLARGDHDHPSRLHDLGFALMVDGLPPAGSDLSPEVGAVALPCDGGTPAATVGFLARRQGNHLALGIEDSRDFLRCRSLGFRWFAGNYPLHPDGGQLPRGTTRHALLLHLLTLITRDADSREIEQFIKQDAHLSYQLLKLVNSVAFSLTGKITSFGQAITLLGRRQLQRWLQLLLYARPEAGIRSPLLPRAALRGSLMEALCGHRPRGDRDRAFMAGMFSLLDLMMGPPLADILAPLHLADDVESALLDRTGSLGLLLRTVEAAETGDFPALEARLQEAGVGSTDWTVALVQAYRWAIGVSSEA